MSLPESAVTDINHAYIAIKLWLLLAQAKASAGDGGTVYSLTVWNELWPPFERLVNMLESEIQSGTPSVRITNCSLGCRAGADEAIEDDRYPDLVNGGRSVSVRTNIEGTGCA
jgi:hypothetical protein